MPTDRKPGLRTADEVRAHAERWPMAGPWEGSGLWRATRGHDVPHMVPLRVSLAGSPWPGIGVSRGCAARPPMPPCPETWTWTPCTPDGDPVELVEWRRSGGYVAETPEALSTAFREDGERLALLLRERDEAGSQLAERDRRIAELEENLEGAEATCDDEEAAHQETLDLLALRTNERDGLDTTLRLALADIERLGRERNEARAQLVERDAEIDRLRASHAETLAGSMELAANASAEIQRAEELRDQAEAQCATAQAERDESRRTVAELERRCTGLRKDLALKAAHVRELAEAVAKEHRAAREASAEIARLRERTVELDGECNEWRQRWKEEQAGRLKADGATEVRCTCDPITSALGLLTIHQEHCARSR